MGTDLFLRMGLDGPNQLDPAQQIRFCAQAVSTHFHGRPFESRDPYQMRLDRFAADLPVGQIGAVTFALSPSLRGATQRSNPAFFIAATKLNCFASLAMTAVARMERSTIRAGRSICSIAPDFALLHPGYAPCICMHEKEFSALISCALD